MDRFTAALISKYTLKILTRDFSRTDIERCRTRTVNRNRIAKRF